MDLTDAPAMDGSESPPNPSLFERAFSRKAGAMLARNTIVSTMVFVVSLGVLWVLVEYFAVDEVLAAGVGFVVANAIHYTLGRVWVFPGSNRHVATGFAYFLIIGGVGLALTLVLFAALLEYTPINYIVARIVVSVIAGLGMFLLNAFINFRRL